MGTRGELWEPEIWVVRVNFDQGKWNSVQVCGNFELFEFELTEWVKWLKSWVKSEGIETHFKLAGEFELSEFELPGFYCINFLFYKYDATGCTVQVHVHIKHWTSEILRGHMAANLK